MTRQEFIAKCDELGINCDRVKAMTDEQFNAELDFQNEKSLKERRP